MTRAADPQDGPTVPQRQLMPTGDRAWIDRVIGGKYRVEGILGRGAMGLVVKARHLRLDELVAIKVLHRSLANDPDMAERMIREARAALRLSSEHVVRVMDVDTLDTGEPFIVLEYLDGIDLASLQRKRRNAPMGWEHAAAIVEQTCRALAEAHAQGIVHRDLKPANLFLVERPDGRRVVKLLDFGISKTTTRPRDAPITKQGDILGSPRYMSPEQVRGDPLDGRSDLWSVGVVLYELLTGTAPFGGDNFAIACRRVLDESPAPLRSLRSDVPPALAAVVERCLEKDRERRFPDAGALRDAVAPFSLSLQRGGSQTMLPDLGGLFSEEGAAPSSQSAAPPSQSAAPPSQGTTAPSQSVAPPAQADAQAAPPSSEPSLASLSPASVSSAITRPRQSLAPEGSRRGSRPLFWLALAALSAAVIAGIVLLLRGSPEPSGQALATAPPPTIGAAAPGTSRAEPAIAASSSAPAAPPPASASGAADPAAAASGASTAAPSAHPGASTQPDPSAQPASKTAHHPPGAPPASSAKPASTAADPFGERRQ